MKLSTELQIYNYLGSNKQLDRDYNTIPKYLYQFNCAHDKHGTKKQAATS